MSSGPSDEDGSDGESGDGGQEWLSYGSWLPQPKIVVEHIHAWRHPQMQQEREKERCRIPEKN